MTGSSGPFWPRLKHRGLQELRRVHGRLAFALGAASRTEPLCSNFGFSRGKPIDRYYIEDFLRKNAADIRGQVLEIQEDSYSRQFGGDRITHQDILHVCAGNPDATIVGDLCDPTVLPTGAFDCIILTQTLHLIFDMPRAIEQLHRSLRPGGVALITVPGITPVGQKEWTDSWYWSLTGAALERLLCGPFERSKVAVKTYGSLYAATSFLHCACVQEVSRAKLDAIDPGYPVTIAARAIA